MCEVIRGDDESGVKSSMKQLAGEESMRVG